MFYQILRFLFRITNKFYFKNLQINGLENIPKNGPVFLAANHPSAFMDPMVIVTITKRPLFMLAKGVLFQNPFCFTSVYGSMPAKLLSDGKLTETVPA